MGAPKIKSVGGGSAKPVADAFNSFLLNQLNSGGFQGMINGQNNPSPMSFRPDMNDPAFADMDRYLQQQQTQNLGALNERFMGPSGRGTPGAFANASFLAQAGPQNTLAMNQLATQMQEQNRADFGAGLQQQALNQQQIGQLMNAFMQSQRLGTPQAQLVQKPSGFSQAMGAIGGILPYAMAPFTGGASLGIPGMMPDMNFFGGMKGLMGGQGFGGFMPNNSAPAGMPNMQMPFIPPPGLGMPNGTPWGMGG